MVSATGGAGVGHGGGSDTVTDSCVDDYYDLATESGWSTGSYEPSPGEIVERSVSEGETVYCSCEVSDLSGHIDLDSDYVSPEVVGAENSEEWP